MNPLTIEDIKLLVGRNLSNVASPIKNRIFHVNINQQYEFVSSIIAYDDKIFSFHDDKNNIVKLVQGDKFYELSDNEDVIISNLNVVIIPYGYKLYKQQPIYYTFLDETKKEYKLEDTKKEHRLSTYNELVYPSLKNLEQVLLEIMKKEVDKIEQLD